MQKKTAIIALLAIGLLAGGAIGLGVGLSRRNKGNSGAVPTMERVFGHESLPIIISQVLYTSLLTVSVGW